jgi:ActR/RegA family two-component response regulator
VSPHSERRPRLLIVDDNRDLSENLQDIFEPRGFVVRFTPSAREGLAMARAEGFDLAMVDVNLPDASGADLLPALRDASPLGEVVLITGHATLDSAVAAVRGGAFQYVVKPFKVDELVATVEAALRQGTLRREREALAQQLAASERRYRDVVESSKVLVVGIDSRGVMHLFNRRAAELTGLSPRRPSGARRSTCSSPPTRESGCRATCGPRWRERLRGSSRRRCWSRTGGRAPCAGTWSWRAPSCPRRRTRSPPTQWAPTSPIAARWSAAPRRPRPSRTWARSPRAWPTRCATRSTRRCCSSTS